MRDYNSSDDRYYRSDPYGSYSRESERLRGTYDEGAHTPGYIVPTRITPLPKKPKRQGRVLRAMLALMCVAVLMLGSGAVGATLAERRLSAVLMELEQRQAYTNQIVNDVVTTMRSGAVTPTGEFNPTRESLMLTELFEGANPAVVAISTQTQGFNVFGRPIMRPSAGSGFLVSENGYIVTNHHVIGNADTISVLLYDGNSYPATLVGGDAHSDLAVLKIEADGLSYLSFADSDILMVGEQVAAIGNPLGEFANSMTVGVVSALDREINIDGVPRNMLQTDAAINRGNSGGPLIDMTGRVVGVVTAKSGGMDVEGLGFAIPSNVARSVTENLISHGFVRGRAVMGVQIGMTELNGAPRILIDGVAVGSGAERAGVQPGDIIISANETHVSTFGELRAILDTLSPGDELSLQVLRNGRMIVFPIILSEFRPD